MAQQALEHVGLVLAGLAVEETRGELDQCGARVGRDPRASSGGQRGVEVVGQFATQLGGQRVAVARRLGRRMPSPNRYRWRFRPMQCRPIVDPRLSCSLRSDLPTVVTAGDRCRFGVTSPAPPDSINGEVCQCPAIRQQRERNPTAATHSSLLKRQEARCPIQHRHSVAASL